MTRKDQTETESLHFDSDQIGYGLFETDEGDLLIFFSINGQRAAISVETWAEVAEEIEDAITEALLPHRTKH